MLTSPRSALDTYKNQQTLCYQSTATYEAEMVIKCAQIIRIGRVPTDDQY